MKKFYVFFLCHITLFFGPAVIAQIPINTVSLVSNISVTGGTVSQVVNSHPASVNGITPSTNYTVNYNNNGNVSLIDFTLAGKTYVRFCNFDTIVFKRVANAWETTNGNKQQIYCHGAATIDNTNHLMPFPIAYPQVTGYAYMERAIKEGYINRGSDNVFNNDATSDLTFNNIERVDFIYYPGILASDTTSAGFLIAERGGNDPFKIVAITAIDVNGNPTAFGPVLSVATSSYGSTIISCPTYVMRKDPGDNALRPFSVVPSQSVKIIYVSLADLGIVAWQKVYGYSLMANDVTATTTAQLLNYTNNTYYPQNTTTANGGMDLASCPGIFHTDQVLDLRALVLSAQFKDGGQYVEWNHNDYRWVNEYRLEKAIDNENFSEIASVRPTSSPLYSFEDKNFKSSSSYRVKVVMNDGGSYYSPIIIAKMPGKQPSISMYPNPARDQLIVNFDGKLIQHKQVSIISVDGKDYGKWAVNDNMQSIKLDISALPAGHYFFKVNNYANFSKAFHFVKQ